MAMTVQTAAADFEAFQPSLKHCCDLALECLCDQAMDQQAASVLLDLERDCEALGHAPCSPRCSWPDLEIPHVDSEPLSSRASEGELDRVYEDLCASALEESGAHCRRYLPERASHAAAMAATVQTAAADFVAIQPSLEPRGVLDEQSASLLLGLEHSCEGQHCDLALEGLCGQAMDEQTASVLRGLERDCEAWGDCSHAPDLQTSQVDLEPALSSPAEVGTGLFRDGAPDEEHDRAYYDLCASALKELGEHCQRLLGDLELLGHELFCGGLRERLAETFRRMFYDYMLWAL